MPGRLIPEHVDLLGNPTPVMKWLEEQDVGSQQSYATNIFDTILGEAAQPRSVSGNACVRLCGFVERVSKSESEPLQLWAFSQDVALRLYDFYIDWNEFDHHRSMRLVLDLIAQLLRRNPDKKAALEIRDLLLDNLISIVIGRSTKPVAKSALKTLDYFLAKGVFNLDDVKATHLAYHQELSQAADIEIWSVFTTELLQWTRLHFICPAAGKFIEPNLLENFKNYIFLPLLKVDRPEGLKFLQKVNQHESNSTATPANDDFDARDSSKTWETPEDQQLFFDYFDGKWLRTLADLVMDPFDDVRDTASLVLAQLFADKRYVKFTLNSTNTNQKPSGELEELLHRAEKVSIRTARADHSDGVARASQLLYKFLDTEDERLGLLSKLVDTLDHKISRAEADLGLAVLEQPLHSTFASLCFTWQAVSEKKLSKSEAESASALQDRMIDCCERVWKAVRDVLCDDSPEGHLPEEMEDTEAFETIGNLAFEQLANLRHRGAFTTVAATFATCCQLTKHLDPVEGEISLLNVWYKGTLNEIFTQRSTTRRSAGIPSMMTGILSANAFDPSFEDAMARLIEIASIEARVVETDGSNLPQVHAYNCLKDIFKNSLLTSMGNKSEKYLPQCLELAASGLRSEVWAIRNCGLIFLRSLIDSLFGSQESKTMIEAGWDGKANRIPYHRYPNLPTVLASLLKSGHKMVTSTNATSSAESVFPALDIIRRAGPPDLLRDEIQIHVAAYLSSPVWHVREIAARTLCSCLLHDKWLRVVQDLFHKSLNDKTVNGQNHVHGVLLSLKFLIERFSEVAPDRLIADLPELTTFLETSQIDSVYVSCPDIIAAYLEVINMIWMSQITQSQPLQPSKVLIPTTNGSALLKAQSTISKILSLSQSKEPVGQVKTLLSESRIGADTMVAALESIQKLWHSASTSDHIGIALCDLYIDVCLRTSFMEPQVVAIENLVELINQLIAENKLDSLPISSLMDMWTILPQRSLNPSLSNAIVRASGCLVAAMSQSKRLSTPSLRNWGRMMADAGSDDKSFDTRFAAAQSLCSFFRVTGTSCTSEGYLPVLLALYDAINDDDDEVREAGSAAARSIFGQNLAPLEASGRLLQWLAQHFNSSAEFKAAVASRITGCRATVAVDQSWGSPGAQLDAALRSDDSLFAVEEQNLFIDEVREANRWAFVFQSLEWDEKAPEDSRILGKLDEWICDGLAQMQLLIKQEDGPLGWASNPHVFAIGTSILRGAVTLKRNHGSLKLRKAVDDIKDLLRLPDHDRVSKLLMEPLEEN
ncbi:hypothetical protein TrVFT333_008504 [Trichoderma virens FT-333]|nr:hypothetical protein TrVFT333_008504 [Trichoderma virens FT-333]